MNTLKALTDEELLTLCASGNNQSMDVLMARYASRVRAYIRRSIRRADEADDILQEAFIKIYLCVADGRYSEQGKFSSWIMRIAHNMIIDSYRRKQQRNSVAYAEYDAVSESSEVFVVPDNAEEEIISQQQNALILRLVDNLPHEQRNVVHLKHYCGLSFREIAEETDVSIGTALGRMRYAVINLRRMMREREQQMWGA